MAQSPVPERSVDPTQCIPLYDGRPAIPAPPPDGPGHLEVSVTHVYRAPGAFDVQGQVSSGKFDGGYPALYGDLALATIPIVVHR